MASTYSALKIELIGTGDQSGTWGLTTNNNLGDGGAGLEQAIVGMATLETADFTANSYTLPYTNTNAVQDFRALVLNITATLSAAGEVIVPAIQKPYIVLNNSVGGYAVTVKVSGQTGVSVPNGAKILVYNNGTDVGAAITHLTSLTLASALPVGSGGTGATSDSAARTNLGATTVGSNFFTLTNPSAIRFPRINADNTVSSLTDSEFRTAIGAGVGGGTVTSVATGTGLTGGPITSTGTVSVATNGITDTLLRDSAALSVIGRSANSTGDPADIAAGSDHEVLRRSGTSLGFGAVALNQAAAITGTLPVGNGGTGITSFGTGVATWLGTPSSANLAAAMTDETGSGLLVFATTPVLTGLREKSVAIAASDINLSLGNYFTRTISGTTTLTVSNVASSGDVAAFILVLTNGGSATVNFFSGVTWAGGTAPALTSSGVDILGFFTINGGTTWRGLVLALNIKAP
jgi:hypothetical protein